MMNEFMRQVQDLAVPFGSAVLWSKWETPFCVWIILLQTSWTGRFPLLSRQQG